MALIQESERDEHIKYLLKLFLKHADDINFYHPSNNNNSLILLRTLITKPEHNNILDELLIRKEIQDPVIIFYLSSCIRQSRHIQIILDIFKERKFKAENYLFSSLLINHIEDNSFMFSKKIIHSLAQKCIVGYSGMCKYFFKENIYRLDAIGIIPYLPWKEMAGFNRADFCANIRNLFMRFEYYITDSHALLHIYSAIVNEYKIQIDIPSQIIEKILILYKQPEQIILLEYMNVLDAYRHMLPFDMPVAVYLRKRYYIRYAKYIYFWLHRTYAPGSKIYNALTEKYENIMLEKCNEEEEIFKPNLSEYKKLMVTNPYVNDINEETDVY
ncbi:hypothetical protein [Drosophila suzukii associated hytrosavirus 1]|nr:hypothetical protein [Drosophila suzukii associated hytrosavirus 1]